MTFLSSQEAKRKEKERKDRKKEEKREIERKGRKEREREREGKRERKEKKREKKREREKESFSYLASSSLPNIRKKELFLARGKSKGSTFKDSLSKKEGTTTNKATPLIFLSFRSEKKISFFLKLRLIFFHLSSSFFSCFDL